MVSEETAARVLEHQEAESFVEPRGRPARAVRTRRLLDWDPVDRCRLLILLTIPITIVTLGLFLLVINALMLALTATLMPGLSVDGFVPAVLGAIVISIVSTILTRFIGHKDERRPRGR